MSEGLSSRKSSGVSRQGSPGSPSMLDLEQQQLLEPNPKDAVIEVLMEYGAVLVDVRDPKPPADTPPPEQAEDVARGWLHILPSAPTTRDYAAFVPLAVWAYLKRLSDTFGWRFVCLVVAVYGLSQGLGEELMYMGRLYYFKDVQKLQPAETAIYSTVAHTPWNIKPIYGLLSDNLPLWGLHRGPYIIMSGLVGTLSWLGLAVLPLGAWAATAFLTSANYSIASPDVMIDAAVAEYCRTWPRFAADLQTLCWGSMAVGGIIGCTCVGHIQSLFGPRGVFLCACLTSVSIMVPASMGWLGERKVPASKRGWCNSTQSSQSQRHLLGLAVGVAMCACVLAYAAKFSDTSVRALGITTVGVAMAVAGATYWVLNQISPKIAKPAIFIFLRAALQPNLGAAVNYWYTDFKGGPQFSPEFLGYIDCVGFLSMLAGVSLYNRYMCHWKYRKIFTSATLVLMVAGSLDLVMYTRANLRLGISDRLFVLGEEAITPLVGKFFTIPMFIMAAKVCPKGVEATLFALLMSLSNFGSDVGSYFGVGIMQVLNITRTDYTNLPWTVLVRALTKLLTIGLIYLLVPDACPTDELIAPEEGWLVHVGPTHDQMDGMVLGDTTINSRPWEDSPNYELVGADGNAAARRIPTYRKSGSYRDLCDEDSGHTMSV